MTSHVSHMVGHMTLTWSSHTSYMNFHTYDPYIQGQKFVTRKSHDLQKQVTGSSHAGCMTPLVPGVSNSQDLLCQPSNECDRAVHRGKWGMGMVVDHPQFHLISKLFYYKPAVHEVRDWLVLRLLCVFCVCWYTYIFVRLHLSRVQ